MKIKNVGVFLGGIIVLIIGLFIVIFDLPQIQFFENMNEESYFLLGNEQKEMHQRLQIEFFIGIVISVLGIVFIIFSLIKKTNKI